MYGPDNKVNEYVCFTRISFCANQTSDDRKLYEAN